jgi:hypothetical protein
MNGNRNRRNTTPKLPGGVTGKGFKPGFDPKRNLKGRPRSFDHFRELALKVAGEKLTLPNGEKITVAEALLRKCAKSNEAGLLKTFFEYAFGKVPEKIETTGLENRTTLILNYADENKNENRSRIPPTVSLGAE